MLYPSVNIWNFMWSINFEGLIVLFYKIKGFNG